MELLGQEKYPTSNGDYSIITYRDNNNDRLQLDVYEIVNDKRSELIYTAHVPMNRNWNLKPREYPDWSEVLAACKQSAIIHSSTKDMDPDVEADIF